MMRQYLTSTKNLKAILRAIQQGQAPDRFTIRFLESLGFKSTSDRLIIGVLKGLRFLNDSAEPQERYVRFLDTDEAPLVLRDAIEEAYAELFKVRRDAHNMARGEVRNKIKTLTDGKLKESVLDKMAATFLALCEEADWNLPRSNAPPAAPEEERQRAVPVVEERPVQTPKADAVSQKGVTVHAPSAMAAVVPQLCYNIQIHLPASKDPAVYDALFKSLKEHLL